MQLKGGGVVEDGGTCGVEISFDHNFLFYFATASNLRGRVTGEGHQNSVEEWMLCLFKG